jgi:hypothetical protein
MEAEAFRARLLPEYRERLFNRLAGQQPLSVVARRLGLNYNALRFWRRGVKPIPSDCLEHLAAAAGLEVQRLGYERLPLRWGGRIVSLKEFSQLSARHVEWMRAPESRKKALATTYASQGKEYFVRLGLRSASRLPPTRRERLVAGLNAKLPPEVEVRTHTTIGRKNCDFAYFANGELRALEEVLGWHRKRDQFFSEASRIFKRVPPDVPTLLTSRYENETPRRTERFPLDLALWALDQPNLLPIFLDDHDFVKARESVLRGLPVDRDSLRAFCRRELSQMRPLKGARAELLTKPNAEETTVHALFERYSLRASGKRMFQTRYGTYIVPDDYLEDSNTAVFVSRRHVEALEGAAFALKQLFPLPIKAIGVTIDGRIERRLLPPSIGLDGLFTLDELEQRLRSGSLL